MDSISSFDPDLAARAERLWPLSPTLQAKWCQAVRMVRSSLRGWVCDIQTPRIAKP